MSDNRSDTRLFPKNVEGFLGVLQKNWSLIFAAIGYGLCRCCSSLSIWYTSGTQIITSSDIGKFFGMATLVLAAYFYGRYRRSFALFMMPSAIAAVGCVLNIIDVATYVDGRMALAGQFLIGFGTAAMMLQWLEYFGRLPVKTIALVIGMAEVFNSLVTILAAGDSTIVAAYITIFVFASALFLALCTQNTGQLADYPRTITKSMFGSNFFKVVIWTAVFCFAYGFVDSIIGLARTSIPSSIGNMVPGIILIIIALFFREHYDIRALNYVALVLMVIGLVLTVYLETNAVVSMLATGAAAASSRVSSYSIACIQSHQHHESSLFSSAIVKTLIVAMMTLGDFIGMRSPEDGLGIIGIVLILMVLIVSIFFSPFDIGENTVYHLRNELDTEAALQAEAESKGLSQRETTVFWLMTSGKTTSEISENLFITKSAVRAHTSRIYEKMGVHSRKEFDDRIKEIRSPRS